MKELKQFATQEWLITSAADQELLLVLSGVVLANFKGNSGEQWLRETLSFLPNMVGPLKWAIQHFSIPEPSVPPDTPPNFYIGFSVEEWALFTSLSSIYNQGHSINSGFAVDAWRPNHFSDGTDVLSNLPVYNIFTGINVDVAVRDTDAWIYRISYNITLLGKIVFPVIIL